MSKNKSIKDFGGKFLIGAVEKTTYACEEFAAKISTPIVNEVYITRILFNDPATIVFWSDGTKTVSKCRKPDTYNPESGVVLCCLKKVVGSGEVTKLLKDWVPSKELVANKMVNINMADVRKKYREDNTSIVDSDN